MADNYLITGYWGEPHVTSENDRGINAATFGAGRFVLPVGEQFKAEYIGNNTVRMYDGKLMDNGAAAGIPAGEFIDLLIANASQGMKRNDLIVFQYSQDASTLIESGRFVVIQGEETSGTAADPALTQQDLLSGTATFDQMAMWRVAVSGTTIAAPEQVFTVGKISGGVTMELLWENARPTSEFAAQTITVPNMAEYDMIRIVFDLSNGGSAWDFYIGEVRNGNSDRCCTTGAFYASSACYVANRSYAVDWSNQRITFEAGSQNGSDHAGRMVPVVVYGIKGVIA